MLFWIWKKDMIKLLKIYICKRESAEDGLEVYEHRADHLSNNLRSTEIFILTLFYVHNSIRNSCKSNLWVINSSKHPSKYFKILNLVFYGTSLVTWCFGLHSNSRGAYEIRDLLTSIDFSNRNTQLLILLSIIAAHIERQRFTGWVRVYVCGQNLRKSANFEPLLIRSSDGVFLLTEFG